uniref:G-protein coupled receptors family 1 profile domain-containing protein n=1 Tax=Ciona intestinalis TaxID=7719 RepID=F6XSI6_CIOIN
ANKCDGNPNCDELGIDECLLECEERPPFCDVNITCLWAPQICDGIWQSDVDCGERINEEELNCPGRFYCKNGVSISISITQLISKVCDGVINCDDESDEAVERNCEDGRFYCEVRRNNTDRLVKDAFFVHKNLMFNGRFDCSDGSDECPSTLDTNAFSSRDEMIGSAALKGILWVIAPLALIGNLVVIWTTTKKILKKAKNQISEIHYFMVLNLAIADGLMGVYLIIIAIMSVQFSGKYCYMDKIWRSGQLCRWIGALLVVSTEASVMILLVMGGFRFYTIFRPYGSQFSEKMGIYNKLLILLAWLLSAVLAIVPLILSDFDNLLWVSGVFFVDDTVSKTVFAEYNRKVNELQKLANFTEVVKNITTANGTTLYKSKILPDVMMRGTFGFYSQNSICLPSLFTRPPDPGWQFTVTVITFNFAAFIMMVLFYGLIWKLSSEERDKLLAANVPTGGKLNYKKCKLQARVTRLLFTDFTCWIPICIMSYIHLSGIDISGNAYAICGIVLLPINSALNPLLYAGLLDKAWKKWKQCCKKDNTSQSGEGKNKKGFLERFQLKNSRSNDYEINSEDRPSAEFAVTTLTTISGS